MTVLLPVCDTNSSFMMLYAQRKLMQEKARVCLWFTGCMACTTSSWVGGLVVRLSIRAVGGACSAGGGWFPASTGFQLRHAERCSGDVTVLWPLEAQYTDMVDLHCRWCNFQKRTSSGLQNDWKSLEFYGIFASFHHDPNHLPRFLQLS